MTLSLQKLCGLIGGIMKLIDISNLTSFSFDYCVCRLIVNFANHIKSNVNFNLSNENKRIFSTVFVSINKKFKSKFTQFNLASKDFFVRSILLNLIKMEENI